MAAHAIMGAFINGFTQGKTKENMEKNKSNLEKHIKKIVPITRDETKAPDVPVFSGSNKTGFELICAYIRDYNEYAITKINQKNEDYKDEVLRDVALMITGNASLLVENLDSAKEIKTNFVSSIETASENKISNEDNFKKVLEEVKKVGADTEKGLKNLVPGNDTPGAVNHSEMIKAVEKCHLINESKIQSFIREQTTSINSNNTKNVKEVKEAFQANQTGTGNNTATRSTHGPPRTTPQTSAWGTASIPRPPPTQTTTPNSAQPNSTPAQAPAQPPTQNSTPNQPPTHNSTPATGNGNTTELITVTRAVAAVDDQGREIVTWTDVHGVKKRNKGFRFTKEAEDAFKAAEQKEAEIARARKQIMIYGLPDPPVGNKKTEIGNIRYVADEFSKKWLQDKGFNIQRSDLKNCVTQRLWNYGGKTHKGPKPLKVTFDTPEIANKFMKAARAAGCDGSRSRIKFGKFQNVSEDSEEWPKYFLRPGSTWEERQVFIAKKKERDAHKASDEYGRYKAAKERTLKNTHNVVDSDLDEFTFLDPDDCGDDDPNLNTKNKCPPGAGGKKSPPEEVAHSSNGDTDTGSGTETIDGFLMDESSSNNVQDPETEMTTATGSEVGSNLNEDDDETNGDDTKRDEDKETGNVNDDKKRKSVIMSPGCSLEQGKEAKKISLAEPRKESA